MFGLFVKPSACLLCGQAYLIKPCDGRLVPSDQFEETRKRCEFNMCEDART
jgi:hypothetical protein